MKIKLGGPRATREAEAEKGGSGRSSESQKPREDRFSTVSVKYYRG